MLICWCWTVRHCCCVAQLGAVVSLDFTSMMAQLRHCAAFCMSRISSNIQHCLEFSVCYLQYSHHHCVRRLPLSLSLSLWRELFPSFFTRLSLRKTNPKRDVATKCMIATKWCTEWTRMLANKKNYGLVMRLDTYIVCAKMTVMKKWGCHIANYEMIYRNNPCFSGMR